MYAFGQSGGMQNYNFRPFDNWEMSPVQRSWFQENPQAAFGQWMRGIEGTKRASNDFTRWAQGLYGDQYGRFQGKVAQDPELQFTDYLNNLNLDEMYKLSNPYGRPLVRRTKLLRG